MLSKLAVLAYVVPLISALTLNVPTNLTSGGQATITWTSAPTDPATFTLELINTVFHNSFAISNNLVPSAGSVTIQLPIVPAGAGYTLEAVQIGNINNVYSTSGSFSIGATVTTTSTSSTSSGTGSSSPIPTFTPLSSSSFGVTASATSITPAGSSSGTSTSPNAASASTKAFNAASTLHIGFGVGPAVLLLSAMAGAAVVVL